jgi:hypothetical protein
MLVDTVRKKEATLVEYDVGLWGRTVDVIKRTLCCDFERCDQY